MHLKIASEKIRPFSVGLYVSTNINARINESNHPDHVKLAGNGWVNISCAAKYIQEGTVRPGQGCPLTHRGHVTHICVSKLGHPWFR